ncbi:hypothetical protein C8Q77DRAFT_1129122 [Trametes polyzona]|nr:hypothetical protein C8Q77DRAFT_1129122 [Trametes polyzona]
MMNFAQLFLRFINSAVQNSLEGLVMVLLPAAAGAHVSSLDSTLGAFLIGTFAGLILYGMSLNQSYRYYRHYRGDALFIRGLVMSLIVLETLHIATCVHVCYTYLVVNYLDPTALHRKIWSVESQSTLCALEILLSQLVYLLRPSFRPLAAIAVVFACVGLGFALAAMGESIRVETFDKFWGRYTWLDSAALGTAGASDILTTGSLIFILKTSHTGFRRTDHMLDRLILYTINTGLLTGILNVIVIISVRVLPNLVSYGIAIVLTKVYANSVFAALNSRHSTSADANGTNNTTLTVLTTLYDTHVSFAEMQDSRLDSRGDGLEGRPIGHGPFHADETARTRARS